jgi:hypothetical protein
MRDQTKLSLAVIFGTILIELSLFGALLLLFLSALPLMAAFDRNLMHGSLSVLEQGVGLSLTVAIPIFLYWAYPRVSDFLRTQMCWALVRRFYGRA